MMFNDHFLQLTITICDQTAEGMAPKAHPLPSLLQSLTSLLLDDGDAHSSCSNTQSTLGNAASAAGESLGQLLHNMLLVRVSCAKAVLRHHKAVQLTNTKPC